MDSIPWEKGNQRLRKTALRAWEKAIRMRILEHRAASWIKGLKGFKGFLHFY